jgi:hypothetical protein
MLMYIRQNIVYERVLQKVDLANFGHMYVDGITAKSRSLPTH